MKQKKILTLATAALCSLLALPAIAQETEKKIDDKYVENDVVSLAGKKGFSFTTKAGDFLLKPYVLVQTCATLNEYDDLPCLPWIPEFC